MAGAINSEPNLARVVSQLDGDDHTDDQSHATEKPLLSDCLPMYPRSKPLFKVAVTKRCITWEPIVDVHYTASKSQRRNSLKGKRSSSRNSIGSDNDCSSRRDSVLLIGGIFLHMADIVGCDCMKGKVKSDKNAYVTIYAYPHKKKTGSKRAIRKRETLTLTFSHAESYEQNTLEAQKWSQVIQCIVRGVDIDSVQDLTQFQLPEQKKILVLVNPASGSGKAVHLFKQRIVPILAEGTLKYEMKITARAGEAREIMQTLDLEKWRGVTLVSGDGMIFEVVNGLMSRPDWEEAMKMPIGCIPGGSGNALACAISYAAEEPYLDNHVLHATFGMVKQTLHPLDLVAIDTSRGNRIYSFLSCCWGLFADVDIETEKYRSLGEARFTIGAISRIMSLRKYRGKVSFLPVEEYVPLSPRKKSLRRSQSEQPQSSSVHKTHMARSQSMMPDNGISSDDTSAVQLRKAISLDESEEPETQEICNTEGLERVDERDHNMPNGADGGKTQQRSLSGAAASKNVGSTGPKILIPPLDQPVPDDWITIDGEFITVAAIYLSHIGKDLLPAAESCLDDGLIYLVIVHGGVTRMKLISLMTLMQKGAKVVDPHVELIKVKAYRYEPAEGEREDGIMTVDGERIEYGPLQGSVLPSMAKVMVPNKGYFTKK